MSSKPQSKSSLYVAVDANSLIHRAFHAFPPQLATTDGVQVNAVYGFTSMLLRILSELDPKYLVCAFDMKEPTFRHTEFVEYKGTRKPTDLTLIKQFPLVKEVLKAFNVPILECKGYEADDILATLAEYVTVSRWKDECESMVIVTGDKDLLQVAHEKVGIWLPKGSFKDMDLYYPQDVQNRFGFGPEYIPDYKGLVGDPSDNIPGIKGIGEKSATKLISECGHLEDIYRNLDSIGEKVRKLLVEGEESAELSRRLATVVRSVPLTVHLEDCLMKDFDRGAVISMFQKFEFRSLVGKIPESVHTTHQSTQMGFFSSAPVADDGDVNGQTKVLTLKNEGKKVEVLGVDAIERPVKHATHGVLVYLSPDKVLFGCEGKNSQWSYFFHSRLDDQECIQSIVKILLMKEISLVTFGWEELWKRLIPVIPSENMNEMFSTAFNVFDIGLGMYHVSSGLKDYSLTAMAFKVAGVDLPDMADFQKQNTPEVISLVDTMGKSILGKVSEVFLEKTDIMGRNVSRNGKPIDYEGWRETEHALSAVIAKMSANGVLMDLEVLKDKEKDLLDEVKSIERMIFDSIGHEFNINSNKQLADVLFVELGLPVHRRRKTGPSTDESVLAKLKGTHPCIEGILTYRERTKMLNTYVRPLIEYISQSPDRRVHSIFRQTGTSTGRLSSDSPNLQNIPIRTELGREIRNTFVAGENNVLISIDYSQIDLRVMADYSRDTNMIDDFLSGKDFHTITAARIFSKTEGEVSDSERRVAKTINFGVLYGLSAFGLSETLGIDRSSAISYINEYFSKYSGVQKALEQTIEFCRKHGYVQTAMGRRRYISGLDSGNRMVKMAAEREAINMPIQGTAADIMRVAMVDLSRYLQARKKQDVKLVLQIHDEFVLEADRRVAEAVAKDLKKVMRSALDLVVPLECEVEIGKSLGSMQKVQ